MAYNGTRLLYVFRRQNGQDLLLRAADVLTNNELLFFLGRVADEVEGTLNAGSGNPKILINMGSELMVINPFTAKSVYNDENGVMINTHAHVIEGL